MNINNKLVGNRIREIRTLKNMTMEEFGIKIDMAHKSLVSKWENGKSLPNKKRLLLIAELGNVSLNYLYYGSPIEFLGQNLNVNFIKLGLTELNYSGKHNIYSCICDWYKQVVSEEINDYADLLIFANDEIENVIEKMLHTSIETLRDLEKYSNEELALLKITNVLINKLALNKFITNSDLINNFYFLYNFDDNEFEKRIENSKSYSKENTSILLTSIFREIFHIDNLISKGDYSPVSLEHALNNLENYYSYLYNMNLKINSHTLISLDLYNYINDSLLQDLSKLINKCKYLLKED
ncbi:helix-turn-helix domain-containing protein [Macrococcoides canis]|uniref:helix-turn-helix domain-containing protein n=1 Tax=Macrococcoides canis TaxID=1855823 RepID=UPI0022B88D4F|nr:helix-turn-helix transcriptional regulator [Macrococcus canis]WBF51998.1 helix-turn-helix domain-containing protein [Macrococcus canis]